MNEVSFGTVNEKLKEAALFVMNNVDDLEGLGMKKLSKLLYFADFNFYKRNQKSITGENYVRMEYGPVPGSIWDVVNRLGAEGKITARKKEINEIEKWEFTDTESCEFEKLSESEKEELTRTISKLGDLSGSELENLSHKDTPWQVTDENDLVSYKLVFYRDDNIAEMVE